MISAKEARKIAKDNKDFFEKHNIENIITKLSLSGHNHCHLAISEKIPNSVIKVLEFLGYKVSVEENKSNFGNPYTLYIEW
ncbi:hypothetical protein [Faecalibacillus intestinalis]|uniref:hypothetical protein n=1 Tax=Faecalibacillus intestinalis TaxID=1982626 RepID=UPI003996B229